MDVLLQTKELKRGAWGKFCMFGMRAWIDHFKEMEEFGVIDVSLSLVIRECIRFCYLDLLKRM